MPHNQPGPPRYHRKTNQRIPDSDDESENQSPSQSQPESRSPSPELRADLPASQLYEIARAQQKKKNDAQKEARGLQRALADVTNEDDTAPQRGRKKRKMVDGGSEDDTKEVKNLAHKFVVMKMIWVPDLADTMKTKIDEQYNPLERFENKKSKVQGALADLMEILPAKFHGETMQSEWLIKTFHEAMGSQRSNTHSRLRNECGPNIFGCTSVDLDSSESRRDKFRKMIGYFEKANGKSGYDAWNVELLHKNYGGSFDVNTVFRSPVLHLAFAVITCGPRAVINMKKTGKPIPSTGQTVTHLWALHNCTVGAIASTAIFVRWAASADAILKPRGVQTGVKWQNDLEQYIKYLQNGLDNRKASVLAIFREWDEIFFPDTETSLAGNGGGDDDDDEANRQKDVMDLLAADEEPVDEPGEGGGPEEGGNSEERGAEKGSPDSDSEAGS